MEPDHHAKLKAFHEQLEILREQIRKLKLVAARTKDQDAQLANYENQLRALQADYGAFMVPEAPPAAAQAPPAAAQAPPVAAQAHAGALHDPIHILDFNTTSKPTLYWHILNTKNRQASLPPQHQPQWQARRDDALRVLTPTVQGKIRELMAARVDHEVVVLVVPSSTAGDISPFQRSVHHFLTGLDIPNLVDRSLDGLQRTESIQKATEGGRHGDRTKGLKIAQNLDVKGKEILLFDDVTTTGGTIRATAEWLEAMAHPRAITLLVLGKTVG